MERQPINLNEVRMAKLVAKRLQLRDELALVDTEIGKLDIAISKAKPIDPKEPIDLDRDSMYRPARFTVQKELPTSPPYKHLLQ